MVNFDLEVDIYEAGVLKGFGPVYQVTELSPGGRLNEAATWGFTAVMKADNSTIHISEGFKCFGYLMSDGGRLPLFGGRITKLAKKPIDGGMLISVSGNGLLGELAFDYLPTLEIAETTIRPPVGARTLTDAGEIEVPEWNDGDTGTSHGVTLANDEWIYIYDTSRFYDIVFDVEVANTAAANIDFETYSARKNSTGRKGWSTISPIIEEWSGGGVPLSTTGERRLTFTVNDPWDEVILDGQQGYYFRFRSTTADISFTLRGITVTIKGPDTLTDFSTVIDASTQFAVKSGGLTATTRGFYGLLNDISVLSAVRRVVDASGDYFRLTSPDVRAVELIHSAAPVLSGLRAFGPIADGDLDEFPDDSLVIEDISPVYDYREQVNKIFVYGNGSGPGSHYTLANHNLEAGVDYPAGYTIDRNESSITYDAGFAVSPLSTSRRYRDIQTLDGNIEGPEVSNQLVYLALAELIQLQAGVEHFGLTVIGFKDKLLFAGDTVAVEYMEYSDEIEFERIEGDYLVTDYRYKLRDGVLVANLTVSSVPRPPMTERDFVLDMMERDRRASTNEQRLRGFGLFGPRVPVEGDGSGGGGGPNISLPDINPTLHLCVPAAAFADEYAPTHAEFITWLYPANDLGAGALYGYAHPGTGDPNNYDWIWQSNGDGTADIIEQNEI